MKFEDIEKAIYKEACEWARRTTKEILEQYDEALKDSRDKKKYKMLTSKRTTVKTVYGEVEYSRRYYNHIEAEGGICEKIFLLDEDLQMTSIGLYSENLVKLIAETATQTSYRQTARTVSAMTGQTISHAAVWDIVQDLGSDIGNKEKKLVDTLKKESLQGQIETDVLFEEIDGVYISLQGADRKQLKRKKQEMKASIAYRGWEQSGNKYKLIDKVMSAGFYSTNDFQYLREAEIRTKYNTDEVKLRILNADGASWIRQAVYENETIYQLDRFHIQREIIRCIPDKKMRIKLQELIKDGNTEKCLSYLRLYADSILGDSEKENYYEAVIKLHNYLKNNIDGIIPYTKRNISIPKPPENIVYRNLGTQENHNFSVITHRMKNNRTSWSLNGATNLARLLTQRENGTLNDIIENKLTDTEYEKYFYPAVLSSAKAPTCDGKGQMPNSIHLYIQDWKQTPSIKMLLKKLGI